jgi:hypothetical protein
MADQNEKSRMPERVDRLVSEMFFERKHSTLKTVIAELESILNDLIYRSYSSGGSENFPFPEKIRWAPELHQKLGKTLFYILFKGQNPKGDLEALTKSLRDHRLGNFCCYQVIGRYDYIIRLWASPIFRDNIKQAIEMLMPADWTYYEFGHVAALNDFTTGQIALDGDRIQIIKDIALIVGDSQGDFESALRQLIERKFAHGQISSYQNRVGFFTLIQLIRGDRTALNEDAFRMLRDDFYEKFKRECKGVKNLSLYSDKERGIILIKYTLSSYGKIGPVMKMLINFADSHHRSFHTKTSLETFVMIPDFPPILNDDGAIPFLISTELSSLK